MTSATPPGAADGPAASGALSTELYDLIGWALGAELPADRSTGTHLVGRVLVALARYADYRGRAWPSQETLAAEISHTSRRDIRNALGLLEAAGLIERDGKVGRTLRWRLLLERGGEPDHTAEAIAAARRRRKARRESSGPAGRVAGDPAGGLPGDPAGGLPGDPAGGLPGDPAGGVAGYPAPMGQETLKGTEARPVAFPRQCAQHQTGINNVPCVACGEARRSAGAVEPVTDWRLPGGSQPSTTRCPVPGHESRVGAHCNLCRSEYLETRSWPEGSIHRDALRPPA